MGTKFPAIIKEVVTKSINHGNTIYISSRPVTFEVTEHMNKKREVLLSITGHYWSKEAIDKLIELLTEVRDVLE